MASCRATGIGARNATVLNQAGNSKVLALLSIAEYLQSRQQRQLCNVHWRGDFYIHIQVIRLHRGSGRP